MNILSKIIIEKTRYSDETIQALKDLIIEEEERRIKAIKNHKGVIDGN